MGKGDRCVVGVAIFDEDMAVKAAHLRNRKDADAAERARIDIEHLALGDIGFRSVPAVDWRRKIVTSPALICPSMVPRVRLGSCPGSCRRCMMN